jgi:hypothetical protein
MAEMHGVGPGPAGGGMANGQPATVKGGADIGTGAPMILTRGLGVVGMACPPCAHVTLHCIVNKKPGITILWKDLSGGRANPQKYSIQIAHLTGLAVVT